MAVVVHAGHKASKIAEKGKLFDVSVIVMRAIRILFTTRENLLARGDSDITRGFWKD